MTGPIERAPARATARRSTPSTSLQPTEQIAPTRETTTTESPVARKKRRRMHVNALGRHEATKWMVSYAREHGERHIVSKAVKQFPQFFQGNQKAKLQKASRWWRQRAQTVVPETTANESSAGIQKKRHTHVNSLSERYEATKWMVAYVREHGDRHIVSKVVKQFPRFFHGNQKAKLQKASRWWRQRDQTMALKMQKQQLGDFSAFVAGGANQKRIASKALGGRGRKRSQWAAALYIDLTEDFERLRSAGVTFNSSVLKSHAKMMIAEAPNDSPYNRTIVDKGEAIAARITIRWVQHFQRCQTGQLVMTPQKQLFIEKSVAFHLGKLKRGFDSGELDEDCIANADEVHFVFNMGSGETLGFLEDEHVKYADFVSGGEPITMMVRLSGGSSACIHPPMLVFKDEARSYPIRGVSDNVAGVCYRTSPKGWMDGSVWCEWLSEPRAIKALSFEQRRTLYVDDCSSHITDGRAMDCLNQIRTSLKKLPAGAAHLIQPANSFIRQKIKDAWSLRWERYKYDCIQSGQWHEALDGYGNGKLPDPGKSFFLKLAADVVDEINNQKDENGVSYARRAMITTGMSLNLNGCWEEGQLTDELQAIIAKHRNHFGGEPVCAEDAETDSDEDS